MQTVNPCLRRPAAGREWARARRVRRASSTRAFEGDAFARLPDPLPCAVGISVQLNAGDRFTDLSEEHVVARVPRRPA